MAHPNSVLSEPLVFEPWEDFVKSRYKPGKTEDEFRKHDDEAPLVVREFYRQNHTHQTRAFVQAKKRQFGGLNHARMGVWEAMEFLNTLVDDSDPDTDLSQIHHLVQTAEACRRDRRPEWFILTGLLHDIGKILCLWGEPQWAVVGDTFVTGCAWPESIVYHQYFDANPDREIAGYQTKLGAYTEGCGLDAVDLSWGHDEYMSIVCKPYMPLESIYMLRYHSFYPWHQEGAYDYLCNAQDRQMLHWLNEFNQYDLYSKGHEKPDVDTLRPYYEGLIAKYFPTQINW